MKSCARRRTAAAIVLLVLLPCRPLIAVEANVPASTQAAIIANLWVLDRNFRAPGDIVLGIVYQEKFRPSVVAAQELCESIERAKLHIRCVMLNLGDAATFHDQLSRAAVQAIYLTPLRSVDLPPILGETRARHIRSVTAVEEYLAAGAAVALTLKGEHPQIVVNLPAARAEGSDFSSQLLKIAKVLQ